MWKQFDYNENSLKIILFIKCYHSIIKSFRFICFMKSSFKYILFLRKSYSFWFDVLKICSKTCYNVHFIKRNNNIFSAWKHINSQEKETITIHWIGMHFICTIERCPVILFPMNLHFMSKKLLNGTNTDTYMRQLSLFSEITPMFM